MSSKMEPALRAVREEWLTVDQGLTRDVAADKQGYFLVKRTFDLLVAVGVIAGVLSWLLPLLALFIKMDSRGPVFFIQKRIGRNGKLFPCYKLRSIMINGRITRFGNWLRSTHLDELPQFLNVAAGSMSLVGPRPYMPADCQRFADWVADGDFRHRIKPGITGMAQAEGLHGTIRKDRSIIVERYHWDAYYVRYADFRMDMRILRKTVKLLLGWKR